MGCFFADHVSAGHKNSARTPGSPWQQCFARRRPHPSLFYARLSAARSTPIGGMNYAADDGERMPLAHAG